MGRARRFRGRFGFIGAAVLAYAVLVAFLLAPSTAADSAVLVLSGLVGWYLLRLRAGSRALRAAVEELRAGQSERADQISNLERARRTDTVTGLGNRQRLEEALPRLVAEAGSSMSSLAVLVLDLEGVEGYREAHGDGEADRALRALAAEWQAQMRINDVLVRVAPSAFVAVLPACSPPNADRVARRLSATTPHDIACRVGVASWDGNESHDQLLRRAESETRADAAGPESMLEAERRVTA